MARCIGKKLNLWMEVAPKPVVYPYKPSNTPELETIFEEIDEEDDDR
ncbi:hypothetical protein ABFS82_10G097300 [Erythranthe guttata]